MLLMDLGFLFQQVANLTGSFSLWLILAIFLLTFISEFSLSPPYLIESIWLLVGYHVSRGMITPEFVILFCLTGLAGRQLGALALYKISGTGSKPFTRLYQKIITARSNEQKPDSWFRKLILTPILNLMAKNFSPYVVESKNGNNHQNKIFVKMRHLTSFHIALGRFIWLKVPLTITMGLTRQLIVLLAGVALFSLAWDGLYILIGVFGRGQGLGQITILLYTFGGFVVVNSTIILVKRRLHSGQLDHST
jgi:membrane-associated protein